MFIDELGIHDVLQRIVRSVTPDAEFLEDLAQEALIHLWREETQHPGQSRGWYLQSCRFHLRDFLNHGRSIDSFKRRYWRQSLPDPSEAEDVLLLEPEAAEPVPSFVSARDILAQLLSRLPPADRLVLEYLAEGLSVEEIAARLHCSHQSVSKHRKRIARAAAELGLEPDPAPLRPRNRRPHR
jgi:RNA polymerase sigma factor (sigma-70 family)